MAIGQEVLSSAALDVAEVDRLTADLEAAEGTRHAEHAAQLQRALDLDAVYFRAGLALQTSAVLALVWRCSEQAAATRLHQARVLQQLGALTALRSAVLTVEQARVVVDVLGSVEPVVAEQVWERLRRRLEQDATVGAVLPPARASELLRRWLIEADPAGAVERRQHAEDADADVELWRRQDGLTDIAIRGVNGPSAQACGQRIRDLAEPIGLGDLRPIGMRLRDAAVDLILGRTTLPFPAGGVPLRCGSQGCGCAQTQPVPCGATVQVLVPLSSALGTADEPAELVGQGPIEPDLLQALLLTDPVLTRVWVDPDTGVPVAVDDRTWRPGRGDPHALRAALLDMARGDPTCPLVSIHPNDHDVGRTPRGDGLEAAAHGPPQVLDHPHPAGPPGPYVIPRWLRRVLTVRSPRCEWPGCGRRAVIGTKAGCDIDHDLAWPAGPTCGCNTGPACRRHHRIKQLGWTKQRRDGGHVRWTSQTGRRWLTRAQHQPPPPPVRPLPTLRADPFAGLSEEAIAQELWAADPADPIFDNYQHAACPDDLEPPDHDTLRQRYANGGLWARLDDPSAWHTSPDPVEPDTCEG